MNNNYINNMYIYITKYIYSQNIYLSLIYLCPIPSHPIPQNLHLGPMTIRSNSTWEAESTTRTTDTTWAPKG